MSVDVETLIIIIIGLLAFLGLFTFVFIIKRYRSLKKGADGNKAILSMNQMIAIVNNPNSSAKELEKVISDTLAYHNKIVQSEYKKYDQLMVGLCSHKEVNKEMVLMLDRELIKYNKEFKDELNATLKKALNKKR